MKYKNAQVGQRIRDARKKEGRSIAWLANEVGCSTQAISQYERGVRAINDEIVSSVASALNVPWQTLVAGTDIQDQTALAIDGAVKLSTVAGVTSLNGVPIGNGEDASKQMHLGLLNRTAARMNDDSLRRVCKVAGIMNSISEKGQEAIVEFAEFQQNKENS